MPRDRWQLIWLSDKKILPERSRQERGVAWGGDTSRLFRRWEMVYHPLFRKRFGWRTSVNFPSHLSEMIFCFDQYWRMIPYSDTRIVFAVPRPVVTWACTTPTIHTFDPAKPASTSRNVPWMIHCTSPESIR